MPVKNLSVLFVCTIFFQSNTISAFSWEKIYNSVIPQKELKEVIYEEYTLNRGTLVVKNKRGLIQIKTGWDNDKIFLKAIKHTKRAEELTKLSFKQTLVNSTITIQTQYDESLITGSIDFELIVPHAIAVHIFAQEGNITVNTVNNPLELQTEYGNIEVIQARNTIKATVLDKGKIVIQQPLAVVYAQTTAGSITINDAQASVFATTESGSIECHSKNVPTTALIKLTTNSGVIALYLPPDVNASLQAETKYGTITSQQFITIKPFVTQLNSDAWKRFKKEVNGTLGSGEAQIKLQSERNSIKIFEEKNN